MRLRKQPDLIAGYVQVIAGNIVGIQGTGFSVSRAGAGSYDVRLPSSYRLVAVLPDASGGIPSAGSANAASNRISMWVSNTGAGTDVSFSFIAARLG